MSDTVRARFFTDSGNAFARTVTFRVDPNEIGAIHKGFAALVERITELDEAARHDPNAVSLRLSVIFAPYDED